MTYIELINNFWTSNEEEAFRTTDVALYFYLLKVNNDCSWKASFKRNNRKVEADLGISFNTLKEARNRLKLAGLIDFRTKSGSTETTYSVRGAGDDKNPTSQLTSSNFDEVTTEVTTEVGYEVPTRLGASKDRYRLREDENRDTAPCGAPPAPGTTGSSPESPQELPPPHANTPYGTKEPPPAPSKDTAQDFVERFNAIRGTRFTATEKVRKQFHARLKEGFTAEKMLHALRNAMQDDFHKSSGYKYLTPEFFTRSDKIDKYLNATQPESGLSKDKLLESVRKFRQERGM